MPFTGRPLIGNHEYQSDDLAAVDRPLDDFAVAEGIASTRTAAEAAFVRVRDRFELAYELLRAATGKDAPNSYTWVSATLDDLADDVEPTGFGPRLLERLDAAGGEPEPDATVGPPDGETVAWYYEFQGLTLIRVAAGARGAEVDTMFRACLGLDAAR